MKAAAAFAIAIALTFPALAGDPVQAALDDMRSEHGFPGATVGHLLTHTGGLPDHVDLPAFRALFASLGPKGPAPEPEARIDLILDTEALFPPGEGWAYSDTGYLLVGLAIERAAGMPWTEVVRTRFLDPLALSDTEPSDRRDLSRLAVGYSAMGDPSVPPVRTLDAEGRMVWHPGIEGAGGGYVTTAADLARWGWHI